MVVADVVVGGVGQAGAVAAAVVPSSPGGWNAASAGDVGERGAAEAGCDGGGRNGLRSVEAGTGGRRGDRWGGRRRRRAGG